MAEARERLLELLHYRIHQLQYRKRTEIAVEIVRQLEAEGRFPQAHYAFDKGVLTLELTRLIESRGKHWVSEIEVSRHTRGRVTGGAWFRAGVTLSLPRSFMRRAKQVCGLESSGARRKRSHATSA